MITFLIALAVAFVILFWIALEAEITSAENYQSYLDNRANGNKLMNHRS